MRKVARDELALFVDWLDPLEDGQYRDQVINMYHGVNAEEARDAFASHPWKEIVLEEGDLRAEALGEAALKAALADTEGRHGRHSPWQDAAGRAWRLYERKQYQAALRVLEGADPARLRPHDQLLRAHARVMRAMHGAEGSGHLGEDTDCRALREALGGARELLLGGGLELAPSDRKKIDGRYRQLERVTEAFAAAAKVQGRLQNRVVDILAGFAGEQQREPRGAALLLLVKFEAGKAIAGDGTACQFVLSMPEEVFRAWALWKLGLNFYAAPAADDPTWGTVEDAWPTAHGKVQRPELGQQFSSLYAFAYFALARAHLLPGGLSAAPEPTFTDLESALAVYERVRTGRAHGSHLTSRRARDRYFELIDRWVTALIAACPQPVSREELLELIEPLPTVKLDGTVLW